MATLLRKMLRNPPRHKKLSEEWALAESEEGESWWGGAGAAGAAGTAQARYAGCANVERAASAPATAKAVASALHVAKESSRKMARVKITISASGVLVSDALTDVTMLNLSIYRISFCSADAARARVFALVEGGGGAGADEHRAHVFVCTRRKHARGLALALAHAFNEAYLAWQSRQDLRTQSCSVPAPSLTIHQRAQPEPWVAFDGESDSDSDGGARAACGESAPSLAPLLTFD